MEDKPVIMTAARPGRSRRIAHRGRDLIRNGLRHARLAGIVAVAHRSLQEPVRRQVGGGPAPREPRRRQTQAPSDLSCPPVSIRAGASTYQVAAPGKQPVGNDLRFQATITRTARDCTLQRRRDHRADRHSGPRHRRPGRARRPRVDIPLRVAVVQSGVQEKTIATKAYRTSVSMSEDGSVPFTLVAEDMVYPAPPGAVGDSYIFYIGFDPQALKPEPKPRAKKK